MKAIKAKRKKAINGLVDVKIDLENIIEKLDSLQEKSMIKFTEGAIWRVSMAIIKVNETIKAINS